MHDSRRNEDENNGLNNDAQPTSQASSSTASVLTSEYQDINRTYRDIAQVLSNYPGLSPQTDVYTFSDGTSALLLRLSGTLPVQFLGVTYRFPVSIWVPHKYPREPPLAYVAPRGDMVVRPGQHVDPQGQIYHPYLNHWPSIWDKSTLLDFIAILCDVFAKEPPVVSQSRSATLSTDISGSLPQQQQSQGRQKLHNEPPPLPPPPPGIKHDVPVPQSERAASAIAPPPLPPKEIVTVGSPHRGHKPSTSQQRGQDVFANTPPPALPAYSTFDTVHRIPPRPYLEEQQISTSRYSSAPALPNSQHGPPPMTYDQRLSRHTNPPEGRTAQTHVYFSPNLQNDDVDLARFHHTHAPRIPQEGAVMLAPLKSSLEPLQDITRGQPPDQSDAQSFSRLLSSPPLVLPDLLDEPTPGAGASSIVLDAPPPVPPNPQKDALIRQLARTLHSMRQESRRQDESSLNGLAAQRAAIQTATTKLQAEIDMLSRLSSLLTSNTSILHDALRRADTVIEQSRNHPETEIDNLLVPPTVVGNQLYMLVAEERAIGDAIFAISRAMEKGRISVAVFTKSTRSLAREWYLKKALIREIAIGMGLSPGH